MKTLLALVLVVLALIPALIAEEIDRKGKKKW
jgi:hypothetical protein